MFRHIDLYCERTGPEFWSEPVNALTNLAFVLAGLWGLSLVRRHGTGRFAEVLCWWVVVIGVGSFLFHTFADSLTIWADVVPIASFIFVYTVFTLRRFVGLGWPATVAVFLGFYAAAGFVTWLVPAWAAQATSGSTSYLPALLAMLFFGAWLAARRHPAGLYDFAAAAIFLAAVTFRALDAHVCEALPLGTHFLWHLGDAVMLAVLLAAAARYGHAPARDAA